MALGVAIVGMGLRGRDWVREVRAAPAFELVACVDSDENILRSAAASLQIPARHCFGDLTLALAQDGCQVIIVATPPDCHVEVCQTVLSKNLAVLVEKPFTLKLKEAVELVSLAESKHTPILVAQNYRYLRSFRTARRLVLEGTLGKIGLVTCQYYRPPHDMAPALARLPHSVLWGMGVHHLDALRFILGQEVTNVMADSFTLPWGQLPEGASLRVMLSFEGGTRASYSATYESSGHEFFERGQEFYTRFVGEHATLHVFQRWLILCERNKLPRLIRRGAREVSEEQILLQQLERAVVHDEQAEVNGRENLKTVALLEACVRSATEQRWVNPGELFHEIQ